MNLKLKDILKVRYADIDLGGLTVITGENDSGKSSIGKILFSMIKAVNTKPRNRDDTFTFVYDTLNSIAKMFPKDNDIEIFQHLGAISESLVDQSISSHKIFSYIRKIGKKYDFPIRKLAIVHIRLLNIQEVLSEFHDSMLIVRNKFEDICRSEFKESLSSYGTENSLIHFHDNTNFDINDVIVEITDGETNFIKSVGHCSIEDATYIESPVYLHILDALRLTNSQSPYSRFDTSVPYHLIDMAEKLLSSENIDNDLFSISYASDHKSILLKLSKIINGSFTLDNDKQQLFFQRENFLIPTVSVASGIKSFGVLMRLLKTNSISTSKLLILDEPEIHLHPEWQIKYCELIVDLVCSGIPIVVSSHSPYFIQGIRYFSAKKGIERDVSYYMAASSEDDNLSNFVNVTDDLNKVFTLLAAPLQEIMNVDAVRNRRR